MAPWRDALCTVGALESTRDYASDPRGSRHGWRRFSFPGSGEPRHIGCNHYTWSHARTHAIHARRQSLFIRGDGSPGRNRRLLVEETEIVGIVRPSIGSGRLGVAMKIEYFHDSRPDADASNRLSVEADQCIVTCWGNGASLGQVS
jgi:hypothetical protein